MVSVAPAVAVVVTAVVATVAGAAVTVSAVVSYAVDGSTAVGLPYHCCHWGAFVAVVAGAGAGAR